MKDPDELMDCLNGNCDEDWPDEGLDPSPPAPYRTATNKTGHKKANKDFDNSSEGFSAICISNQKSDYSFLIQTLSFEVWNSTINLWLEPNEPLKLGWAACVMGNRLVAVCVTSFVEGITLRSSDYDDKIIYLGALRVGKGFALTTVDSRRIPLTRERGEKASENGYPVSEASSINRHLVRFNDSNTARRFAVSRTALFRRRDR